MTTCAPPRRAPRSSQPLWAAVPRGRAGALPAARRAGRARRARPARRCCSPARPGGRAPRRCWPSCCPSVAGLDALADDGPRALADRRLGRPALLRGGRRAVLVQAPRGRRRRARRAAPRRGPSRCWRSAASLLAGNAVAARAGRAAGRRADRGRLHPRRHAGRAARRRCTATRRLDAAACDRVVDLGGRRREGDDARARAARRSSDGRPARCGRRSRAPAGIRPRSAASSWRPALAEPLLGALVAGAPAAAGGRPASDADTEVGPLASREDLEAVEAAGRRGGGGRRRAGCAAARSSCPGSTGAFYAPIVLRGVRADARLLREPPPGPVLAVLEAGRTRPRDRARRPSTRASARGRRCGPAIARHGERVARSLGAELAWVNEHGAVGAVGPGAARPPRRPAPARLTAAAQCAARAGCPTTRRSSARARPPRGCCTAARASACAALPANGRAPRLARVDAASSPRAAASAAEPVGLERRELRRATVAAAQ